MFKTTIVRSKNLYNKISIRVMFLVTICYGLLIVGTQTFGTVTALLTAHSFPILVRWKLSFLSISDYLLSMDSFSLTLFIASSFLGGLNISLVHLYFEERSVSVIKHGVRASLGSFVAIIGIGCGACGGLIITYMSFLSGTYLSFLYKDNILSIIGLFIMIASTYLLYRELERNKVC